MKFKLEAGPDEMTITDKGVLHWSVPDSYSSNQATVIVQISDASRQEIYHVFKIDLRLPPVPSVTPIPPLETEAKSK